MFCVNSRTNGLFCPHIQFLGKKANNTVAQDADSDDEDNQKNLSRSQISNQHVQQLSHRKEEERNQIISVALVLLASLVVMKGKEINK